MKILIKPLSVNHAWRGRRFKTPQYTKYQRDVTLLLSNVKIPLGALKISLTFGFSSRGSDVDNPIKPILDILQKKYKFNDNRIYELNVKKIDVKKGAEFIDIVIEKLDTN